LGVFGEVFEEIVRRCLEAGWWRARIWRYVLWVGTPAYERSRQAGYKIEALFAELK
jgi:hypothetical protein